MPELPDVELYLSALRPRIGGRKLERVRLATPFLLRSVEPPLEQTFGRVVVGLRRIGKRIVWEMEAKTFLAAALQKESHTVKRALTDPHLLSGIGNAYSDEILHRARMSPFKLTRQLTPDEIAVLHRATVETLAEWTARLQEEAGEKFPEKVTAFHEKMAVHGQFGKPCPRCGTSVQRIVHGEHQVNYCPGCQTEGRLLADRALSKLMKDDWPKTLDELERRRRSQTG